MYVLLSCSPGEFSFEHKSFGSGHGVFFYHVIEGLNGAAHDADGRSPLSTEISSRP
jgi:uncharacterized caspase-like protein